MQACRLFSEPPITLNYLGKTENSNLYLVLSMSLAVHYSAILQRSKARRRLWGEFGVKSCEKSPQAMERYEGSKNGIPVIATVCVRYERPQQVKGVIGKDEVIGSNPIISSIRNLVKSLW